MLKRLLGTARRELVMVLQPIEAIDFGAFKLTVDRRDYGGRMYRERPYWGALSCPFERNLIDRFKPRVFVDVGANYGFTALVHHVHNPEAAIIAVEPSPVLASFLEENLKANGLEDATIVRAVCTARPSTEATFALNPSSSQDNRVRGEKGWTTITTSAVTIDHLLADHAGKGFVLIKVDTQGHEADVISGAATVLDNRRDWAMKMEFAPKWLRSQGTDPVVMFRNLASRFDVAEIPQRARFQGDDVAAVMRHTLSPDVGAAFTQHIESRAKGDGWCDLIILPRGLVA